jgi:hypothetical protein
MCMDRCVCIIVFATHYRVLQRSPMVDGREALSLLCNNVNDTPVCMLHKPDVPECIPVLSM